MKEVTKNTAVNTNEVNEVQDTQTAQTTGTAKTPININNIDILNDMLDPELIDLIVTSVCEYMTKTAKMLECLMENQKKIYNILMPKVKEKADKKKNTEHKIKSKWYIRMNCKYELLIKELKITRRQLYALLYTDIETLTGINVDQAFKEYCIENKDSSREVFRMDCIENNDTLRQAIENIVDEMLLSNKIIPKPLLDKFNADESLMRIPNLLF